MRKRLRDVRERLRNIRERLKNVRERLKNVRERLRNVRERLRVEPQSLGVEHKRYNPDSSLGPKVRGDLVCFLASYHVDSGNYRVSEVGTEGLCSSRPGVYRDPLILRVKGS
ncbi:MAG: hypothetical protein LBU25_04070 [Treponema sp.]|jgi:hypothetical protein|nr:hypothetical protein [Treponema sp.]